MRKPCSSRSSVAEKKARELPWDGTRRQPLRGLIRESRCGPGLRGHHQPVGVPVPAHGEEPLGVRGVLEPAQPQLEVLRRDGAVGEFDLLGHGSEAPR